MIFFSSTDQLLKINEGSAGVVTFELEPAEGTDAPNSRVHEENEKALASAPDAGESFVAVSDADGSAAAKELNENASDGLASKVESESSLAALNENGLNTTCVSKDWSNWNG